MFSNLKLGTKIALGFFVILLIAFFLGGLSIVSMTGVKSGAEELAREKVPEVSIANDVERASYKTILDIRGYGYIEEKALLESGKINFSQVNKFLKDAKEYASKYPRLSELKKNADKAQEKADEYDKLIKASEEKINIMAENRKGCDEAAKEYMTLCNEFLESQNKKLEEEVRSKVSQEKILERIFKIKTTNDVIDLGNEIRVANFKSQVLREPVIIEGILKNFDTIDIKIESILKVTVQDANIQQLKKIETAGDKYQNNLVNFLKTWKELQIVGKQRGEVGDAVIKAAEDTSKSAMEKTTSIANNSSIALGVATVTMVVGLIGALVLGIIIALVIITNITRPVNRIVSSLSESAGQIASASGQLSSSSQQLAEGASEQASALEETSSTLNESSSMVQQNTENTKQAALLSEKAKESADKGNREMKEMLESMNELKKSSDDIARIIKVIDDIAFQTNILALNAAVEAARAGDAGMGFAVVAEEVRNLAQRSAQAAKDTSSIIERNIKLSEKGVDVSKKVSESLADITIQAKKVNELMDEIAAASTEQSQGIDQISRAINQMEQVTQSTASAAEESAAASEQLTSQADGMKSIVEDLNTLVYGKSESGLKLRDNGAQSVRQKEGTNYSRTAVKRNTGGGQQIRGIPKSTGKKTTVVNPEQIIPLEDDMKDF